MPKKQRQATRTTPGFTGPFKGEAQQGTLFDKRTMLDPDRHIGPRGYSPERIRAIRATGIANRLIPSYESVESAQAGIVGAGRARGIRNRDERPGAFEANEAAQGYSGRMDTIPEVAPDQMRYGPAYLGPKHNNMDDFPPPDTQRKMMARPRTKLEEDLARSTVPPEHLNGLDSIYVRNQRRTQEAMKSPRSVLGVYKGHKSGAANKTITLAQPSGEERDAGGGFEGSPERIPDRGPTRRQETLTFLHELGHHVSASENTQHSDYRTPGQRGREEAYADTYMLRHYRADPRDRNWEQVGYMDPREHTYEGHGIDVGDRFGYKNPPGGWGMPTPNYDLAPRDRPMRGLDRNYPTIGQAMHLERRQRPMLPGMAGAREGWGTESGVESGVEGDYGPALQKSNQARQRPLREMQQAYVKARWSPRNRGDQ